MIHSVKTECKYNFKGQSDKPWHITKCYIISDSKASYFYELRIANLDTYEECIQYIKNHDNENVYAWHDRSTEYGVGFYYSSVYLDTHTKEYRLFHNIIN